MSEKSTHNRVAQALAERILGGELTPGSTLPPEIELSRRLGISRSVLREAFKILTAKGMLESRTKIGTRVRERVCWNFLDPAVLSWAKEGRSGRALAENLRELQLLVDPAAAGFAATRGRPAEIQRILGMPERIGAAKSAESLETALQEFRAAVLQASRNDLLITFQTLTGNTIDFAALLARSNEISRHCEEVGAAIASHDQIAAETAMRDLVLFVAGFSDSTSRLVRLL